MLLLFKANQGQKTDLATQSERRTNPPSQSEPSNVVGNHQVPNTSQPPWMPATAPPASQTLAAPYQDAEKILELWQAPISFYGKVVDENSNAVAGAQVSFHWVEEPAKEGNRGTNIESDIDGLFSLMGARRPDLAVSVSKEGYYSSHEEVHPVFKYGFFADTNYSPDPVNPIVFHLRKKGNGATLITTDFPISMGQIAQLHHDGTPVELDLLKVGRIRAGSGQLKLEFWREITNRNAHVFDWKMQLSILGGGLVKTDEEFDYQAPSSGYQPAIVIDMPATNQNWQGEVRCKYYIQLANGNYGRIDFYFLPYNGVFTVHSAINPSGSQNLEAQ
jgi:hypothetical protein